MTAAGEGPAGTRAAGPRPGAGRGQRPRPPRGGQAARPAAGRPAPPGRPGNAKDKPLDKLPAERRAALEKQQEAIEKAAAQDQDPGRRPAAWPSSRPPATRATPRTCSKKGAETGPTRRCRRPRSRSNEARREAADEGTAARQGEGRSRQAQAAAGRRSARRPRPRPRRPRSRTRTPPATQRDVAKKLADAAKKQADARRPAEQARRPRPGGPQGEGDRRSSEGRRAT